MKDLQQALSEIHSIRTQVARGTEFHGYGPASIAASGILALAVAGPQTQWVAKSGEAGHSLWLRVSAGAAVGPVLLALPGGFAPAPRQSLGLVPVIFTSPGG